MSEWVRIPAVAGLFYPADRKALRRSVKRCLNTASVGSGGPPAALIVPHAGYIYSGPVAGSAYSLIRSGTVRRVLLMGPAHRVRLEGIAASSASLWRTPLGDVPVERPAGLPIDDTAHAEEHSLEVQLPFLQSVLEDFTLIPLVVGRASGEEVAAVLESLRGGPETLIVISSDLSHYHSYAQAQQMDRAASEAILTLNPAELTGEQACGCVPIRGLLQLAKQRGLRAELVDLRNSGDTAGPRDQVVGYGAYAFYP